MPESIYIFIILALFISMLWYRDSWRKERDRAKVLLYENVELQQALDSVLRKR